jgi:hypothetical protein
MWLDKLENPEAITSVFETAPSLEDVELLSVTLSQDGPTMLLVIALNESPSKPSPRWQRAQPNAVSVKLQLFVVENIRLEGWATDTKVRIDIEGERGGNITVTAVGLRVKLTCSCRFCSVKGITPYHTEKPYIPVAR